MRTFNFKKGFNSSWCGYKQEGWFSSRCALTVSIPVGAVISYNGSGEANGGVVSIPVGAVISRHGWIDRTEDVRFQFQLVRL